MLHQIYFNSWSLQPCSGPLYGTKIKTATVFTDQFCVLVFVRGGHERGSLTEAEAPRPTTLPPFPPYLRCKWKHKAAKAHSGMGYEFWAYSPKLRKRCAAARGEEAREQQQRGPIWIMTVWIQLLKDAAVSYQSCERGRLSSPRNTSSF